MTPESLSPYKGLSSYTEADTALFAGRDRDIRRCGAKLADRSTRILILHGLTGCGKSSFLRAGIIPFLEQDDTRLAFARRGKSRDVFISCTADPLAKLANAIFEFTSNEISVETPAGSRTLNLRSALPNPEEKDAAAFVRAASRQPRTLLEVLERLSLIVPETLVLIVDQGEEILTLTNPALDSPQRNLFFEFLSEFSLAQFAMKVLVSLRTEYLGRFVSHLPLGLTGSAIGDYYLSELDKTQIKEALIRPSEQYGFSIEDGVVDAAIDQLSHAPLGRLGALQIAFNELYELMRSRAANIITRADLAELGDVEGSIERFVQKALYKQGTASGLSPVAAEQEASRWKEVLCELIRRQPDGTVTTDIKAVSELRERLASSLLDFERTTASLLAAGLLKPINVVDGFGNLVPCFGIGHDTVGLVLWNWKSRREQTRSSSPVLSQHVEFEEAPSLPGKDIAVCLSGGGYRAMLFGVGAVWRLNELGYLTQVGRFSGVAGGAVVAGFLGMRWKDLSFDSRGVASNFADMIVNPLLEFADYNIDVSAILLGLTTPWSNAADLMADKLQVLFGNQTLQDLPDEPIVVLSATNLQRVSLFRFSKAYMGDINTGLIRTPKVKLATAVAASNALPPVLSPLILKLENAKWEPSETKDARFRERVYLATGSIIDNLGLEAAWRRHQTIFICDGAVESADDPEPDTDWARQSIRTVEVIDHQLRSLRRRQVIDAFLSQTRNGAYWSIRNIAEYGEGFDAKRAAHLAALPTRFAKVDAVDKFDLINLGYLICDSALADQFERKPRTQALRLPYPRPTAA
ncbi:patatin-like phospholipase family protein [Bradyrhizobium yuanmingense]|uniref:nSTAND1 domain-containing NTPase n=1 Tax=Bradyrhizobium yuanmingense TaxID=108015 RepID=UPI0023B8EFD6|nr:patatin-like phospholipase family protein [Bradyrhizobium yuanmingense]MDF0521734.1 patatin-like phospholipase family protein [Bradyrhizobium yuanmingense]